VRESDEEAGGVEERETAVCSEGVVEGCFRGILGIWGGDGKEEEGF
jgi:hypothetical protein